MSDERRKVLREEREKQVKRQKKMIMVLIVIIMLIITVILTARTCGKDDDKATETLESSVEIKKDTVTDKKNEEETEEERLKRVRREAQEAGYPEGVIELLSKNPETVDFVEHYERKKEVLPVETIEELMEGEIPHLLQWDDRWGYAPYGTSIVAVSGCGPTCLSMVLSGLTGDDTLTPARIAEYGTENHYINEDNDTYWSFMAEAAKNWGVQCREKILDEDKLKEELTADHPIICIMGPGDFTQIGHFIVFAGYEDGKVIVYDPFSQKNSEKRWEYEEIKDQIKSMWTYQID